MEKWKNLNKNIDMYLTKQLNLVVKLYSPRNTIVILKI